eukprot:5447774-Pyramimonas_sp.AAC.1
MDSLPTFEMLFGVSAQGGRSAELAALFLLSILSFSSCSLSLSAAVAAKSGPPAQAGLFGHLSPLCCPLTCPPPSLPLPLLGKPRRLVGQGDWSPAAGSNVKNARAGGPAATRCGPTASAGSAREAPICWIATLWVASWQCLLALRRPAERAWACPQRDSAASYERRRLCES